MIRLLDGPVEGSYAVQRAPLYLRAVVTEQGDNDVLDQLEDRPAPAETVHVYRRDGEAGTVHVNRGGRGSGFYAMADYRHMPDVDGEALRDNVAWREWAEQQP